MRHPIFKLFSKDLDTHVRDMPLTVEQKYHIECWQTCKAISTALDKLDIAKDCIENSYNHAPNEQLVYKYIEFHIENYLIRSRAVYDRVLIFTNSLCGVGKSREDVKHRTIINNSKVKSSGLVSMIDEINDACNIYREIRNSVVHHDKYESNELAWIEAAIKSKRILNGDIHRIGITNEDIANNVAYVIAQHLYDFSENSKTINQLVFKFLDASSNIYDIKTKRT
ncbi:hypothetical protein V9R50_002913 [Vibrio cholerae]